VKRTRSTITDFVFYPYKYYNLFLFDSLVDDRHEYYPIDLLQPYRVNQIDDLPI